VTLHEVAPVEAMRLSFIGCLRNILTFLVYGVLLFILSILASIPFGLGWLVLLPIIVGSIYAGYRDIFLQHCWGLPRISSPPAPAARPAGAARPRSHRPRAATPARTATSPSHDPSRRATASAAQSSRGCTATMRAPWPRVPAPACNARGSPVP